MRWKTKKRGQKSDADFHIFVPGSCCDLRHVQLSDARNTELVLVRVSRLFLCLAGGSCGLSEAKKHPQEWNVAASDHNGFMCFVGSFYGMAWLVDRLRISIRSTGSPGFDPCDRKDQPSGKRRIPVLSDTIRRYRMYSCNPDRSRPHYLHLAVCIKCRDQLSDAGRFVYFSEKGHVAWIQKEIKNIKN